MSVPTHPVDPPTSAAMPLEHADHVRAVLNALLSSPDGWVAELQVTPRGQGPFLRLVVEVLTTKSSVPYRVTKP